MKRRDFQLDAWEMTRRHGAPGDVAFAIKCMEFGYGLGIGDATLELAALKERIKEEKERSNRPR